MKRHILSSLVFAALAACSGPLIGQELWDMSMRVSAGSFSGAADAGLGKNYFYGVSGDGAYPFTPEQWLACDAGYRLIPKSETAKGTGDTLEVTRTKTQGYFAGAYYRWQFSRTMLNGWLEGLYVQGGLRLQSMRTENEVVTTTTDPKETTTKKVKGQRDNAIKPLIGAGFRITDKISVSLNMVGMSGTNLVGKNKSAMVIEAGLGLHF